jgi:hypothetical protein
MPTAGPIAFALSPILAACVLERRPRALYEKGLGCYNMKRTRKAPLSGVFLKKTDLNPIWSLLYANFRFFLPALEKLLLPGAAMPDSSVKKKSAVLIRLGQQCRLLGRGAPTPTRGTMLVHQAVMVRRMQIAAELPLRVHSPSSPIPQVLGTNDDSEFAV